MTQFTTQWTTNTGTMVWIACGGCHLIPGPIHQMGRYAQCTVTVQRSPAVTPRCQWSFITAPSHALWTSDAGGVIMEGG